MLLIAAAGMMIRTGKSKFSANAAASQTVSADFRIISASFSAALTANDAVIPFAAMVTSFPSLRRMAFALPKSAGSGRSGMALRFSLM